MATKSKLSLSCRYGKFPEEGKWEHIMAEGFSPKSFRNDKNSTIMVEFSKRPTNKNKRKYELVLRTIN